MKLLLTVWTTALFVMIQGCGPSHHLLNQQLDSSYSGRILSVQGYVIKNEKDAAELKSHWLKVAEKMKERTGFLGAWLSPGVDDSPLWLACSEWRDVEDIRKAFSDAELLRLELQLPAKQFEHLFKQETEVKPTQR